MYINSYYIVPCLHKSFKKFLENSTWSKMLHLIKIIYLYTLMVSTIYTQAIEKVFGGVYSLIQNRSQSERTIVFSLVT